jgi:hypothetical protein
LVFLDWYQDPTARVASFTTNFEYDPAILQFRKEDSTLVCDLRSDGVAPYCPSFAPGQGTTSILTATENFSVDQTGLTINEGTSASGLPSINVSHVTPSTQVFTAGERIFLALAFDLIVPLAPGATVTYSPDELPNSTLLTTSASCTLSGGAIVDCQSAFPSLSLKIDPVPAPLAAGGLPAMAVASRRLRQRIRQVGR